MTSVHINDLRKYLVFDHILIVMVHWIAICCAAVPPASDSPTHAITNFLTMHTDEARRRYVYLVSWHPSYKSSGLEYNFVFYLSSYYSFTKHRFASGFNSLLEGSLAVVVPSLESEWSSPCRSMHHTIYAN